MENVIILSGGIGNQLFQISAAFHNFHSFKLYEKNLLNYKTKRESINGLLIPQFDIYKGDVIFDFIVKTKITYKFSFPFFWKPFSYYFNIRFLTGYYQDSINYGESMIKTVNLIEKYNSSFLNKISQRFEINFYNSAAIHLRFGDYLNDNLFYKIDLSYIKNALKKIKEFENLYIFCNDVIPDDINNFLNENAKYVFYIKDFNLADYEELLLMSQFSKLIISNSTFSFWAGLIGNAKKKKLVLCPDKFYNNNNNNYLWKKNCIFAGFQFA